MVSNVSEYIFWVFGLYALPMPLRHALLVSLRNLRLASRWEGDGENENYMRILLGSRDERRRLMPR